MKNKSKVPMRQESLDGRALLDRILDTPQLERLVPHLQPDLLHRVIQSCGLEDCGELVALASPRQLTRIFDLDLWRPARPGTDEQFDAARFGVWLEVLAEFDAALAAQKLAQMDAGVVIAGLAQHARVFDCATAASYSTTDGVELPGIRESGEVACEVGGYRLAAKRTDSWEAIVEILIALDAEHPDYFHQVMRGCRALSDSGRELDGLDDLLGAEDQNIFELVLDRERRRDKQGYVTPAQARAFFQASRQLRLDSETMPHADPVTHAYFRSLDLTAKAKTAHAQPASKEPLAPADLQKEAAALTDVLLEAGIIAQQPRALLERPQDESGNGALRLIRTHMQCVFDRDYAAYSRRNDEFTYLANTIMAGCALQDRPFTTQETWDAAVSICNLGLENWPSLWNQAKSLTDNFLVNHDLVIVFQVGWAVLYKDVVMYATEQLLQVLSGLRCYDGDLQRDLHTLRIELSASCRAGTPWRTRDALEAIAILDLPAWTALCGLIDECPVLPAALSASRSPGTRSISPSAFEFISENSQIACVRAFMTSLPETLRP